MTAIAGLIRLDGGPVDGATIARMGSVLESCGPDSQKHWQGGGSALLRTLLRVTPEDALDRQPLVDPASRDVLVFDGRIDNRDELARELGIAAAEVVRMADSELVQRACLCWDVEAVDHLLGDFALAVWQPTRRRLWLARDPVGHRPLFWHRQPGFFAFATLPKALFAIPGVPRAICEERLADHLALLPHRGPESFFKDVFRIEPGTLLILDDGRPSVRRYHSFDDIAPLRLARDEDYVEALREQLDRAVGSRLRALGPIATQLSSGFDSATVTAVAARLLAARNQSLIAYTAVPREGFAGANERGRHGDEGPGAKALAARFPNIEHVLIRPDGRSIVAGIQDHLQRHDSSPRNPCNMTWADAINEDAARRGVKAILVGQRGNMTISYDGLPRLGALVGSGRWLEWRREMAAVHRVQKRRWRGLLALSFGPFMPRPLWAFGQKLRGRGTDLGEYTAFHPEFAERAQPLERARSKGWDLSYRPWADGRQMRIAVLGRVDPGEHFAATNVMSGLELRDPLADIRLISFCLSVPDRQFLHEGQDRWLLRRLMQDVLPPEILQAHTKGLQAADWHETFASDLPRLREEMARLVAHGGVGRFLDLDRMTRELEAWPEQGFSKASVVRTYRLRMLRGLATGAFIRHIDDNNA